MDIFKKYVLKLFWRKFRKKFLKICAFSMHIALWSDDCFYSDPVDSELCCHGRAGCSLLHCERMKFSKLNIHNCMETFRESVYERFNVSTEKAWKGEKYSHFIDGFQCRLYYVELRLSAKWIENSRKISIIFYL